MFGPMFRDFDDDPFFSDMHEMHRNHMRSMQSMFGPSFGPIPFLALEGGSGRHATDHHGHGHRGNERQQAMQPFGMSDPFSMGFGNMFSNMQNMMANMHRNFEQMANNPDAHSFSHSSYTSYSSTGDGAPQVYQATSSTRQAPGGVKETRRSVRDSEAGMEKMAVGHHLGDRAHVIERSRYSRTGQMEEKQDFTNLDETDADSFNQEWQQRTRHMGHHHAVGNSSRHRYATPALTDGRYDREVPRRDRSPTRPTGPSLGGRRREHTEKRPAKDRRH